MRFNPFKWSEVKTNEKTDFKKGWLRVRSSRPAALYIEAEGVQVLVGFGSSWDLQFSEGGAFFLDAPEPVRVFYEVAFSTSSEPDPEVYTNIDRMTQESGSVLEVRKAMRDFELQKRAMLRDIRVAQAAAVKAAKPAPAPASQPELEAKPEAKAE